jgi:2-haloalkanoic acid dehalogenase type II
MKYKLVSFDMFQTLVDVESQKYEVMKAVFGEAYTKETADQLWEDSNNYVYAYFHRFNVDKEDFKSILNVFTDCYSELFPKYGIKINPYMGATILAKRHNDALFYPETRNIIEDIKEKYKICLISDADTIMIKDILKQFYFDKVYISEDYREYKSNVKGTMFKLAINEFGIKPYEMIHIGDGYNDVVGAKKAGADAIWINRNNREWKHTIKPDYIVNSLSEIEFD